MSYKRVLRTLARLGLSRKEAEVYIRSAFTKGPIKAKNIAETLNITLHELDEILKNLQTKGLISPKSKEPYLFSTVPFEEALLLLLRQSLSEAQTVDLDRERLLASWQKMLQEPTKVEGY